MSTDSKITGLDTASASAVAETKSVKRAVATRTAGHDAQLSGKTLELNIYASEQEHGSNAVEIGLNGVMYLVPRGEYFTVPEELVEILRTAITSITSPAKNGGGVTTRDVPRFNFQTR